MLRVIDPDKLRAPHLHMQASYICTLPQNWLLSMPQAWPGAEHCAAELHAPPQRACAAHLAEQVVVRVTMERRLRAARPQPHRALVHAAGQLREGRTAGHGVSQRRQRLGHIPLRQVEPQLWRSRQPTPRSRCPCLPRRKLPCITFVHRRHKGDGTSGLWLLPSADLPYACAAAAGTAAGARRPQSLRCCRRA